ncbi:MAG TPA: formate dehydrogenase accessory sulfurtransferase FdhD [Porticoccaceae bacterium]|jgi:formate dehydrogenase accessory protein FdhD|nr:formate dehydrogenase accessory sulfurtransferase FdhD [Gammaproteobacteria bacterium]HIL59274.1 formate dehydrogenase accessory sulfurtransferase FdhD [Porticoccaceae bacterium]
MSVEKSTFTKLNSESEHSSVIVEVGVWAGGIVSKKKDSIATEMPIALVYNDVSHAVMMASPQDVEAFALGFSLTEEIISSPAEIYELQLRLIEASNDSVTGMEVAMTISSERFALLKERRRNLVGRTGCGICGAESLQQLRRPAHSIAKELPSELSVTHSAINSAVMALQQHQTLQSLTGAVHGAAWCNQQGKIVELCEDVGRHNAVDKLVGKLAASAISMDEGFLLVSSRASYEIVQKAAVARIAIIVAVSAPTSLAIEIAEEGGLSLVGFARDNRHVCYSNCHRLD